MTSKYKNKNGVKLLAAFAVIAMVIAATAIAVSTDTDAAVSDYYQGSVKIAGGDTDATTDDVYLKFPQGLSYTTNGNTITFTGIAPAALGTTGVQTTAVDAIEFSSDFAPEIAAKGYAFVSFDGLQNLIGSGQTIKLTQTNNALYSFEGLGSSNITGNQKVGNAVGASSVQNGAAFLIPKDGSSVVFKIEVLDSNSNVVNTYNYTFDFTKVSTIISLGSSYTGDSGTGWTFVNNDKKLTLNNYNGNEIFTYTDALTVELVGQNKITSYQNTSNTGAIDASKSVTIKSAGETPASLTVDVKNSVAFGIAGHGSGSASVFVGDAGVGKTTLTINGIADVGIFAYGGFTANNADISAIGSERAIRVGSSTAGNASITNSNINATILGTGNTNGLGDDDIFGMKITGTLDVDGTKSKVITDGLAVNGATLTNEGIIIVNGEYTQNPNAGIPVKVSGLYLGNPGINSNDGVNVLNTTTTSTTDMTAGKIYLYNADYYGNVKIVDSTGTVVEKNEVVSTDEALATAMNDDKVTSIIMTAALTSDVVLKKDLTFSGTIVNTGKVVTISNGASLNIAGKYTGPVKNGNNTMTLNGLAGNYSVVYGSVEINGVVTEGSIELDKDDNKIQGIVDGSITISNATNMKKIYLSGDLTINSSKSLTVGTNNVLIIPEGRTLTVGGTLTVNGAIVVYGTLTNNGTINGSGKYAVAEGVSFPTTGVSGISLENILIYEGATAIENTISGNTEWNTATYLTGQLTIEEGVTVTIGTKGYLDLRGNQLIVKGTLIVNGYITNTAESASTIYMASTGTIENAGTIGKDNNITVSMYDSDSSYSGIGSVILKNINGISFGIQENYVGATKTYTLVLSGDVSKKGDSYYLAISNAIIDTMSISDLVDNVSGNVVTITDSTVKTDLTIGNRAVVKIVDAGVVTLGSSASLVVDGELVASTGYVKLLDGAVASINGKANVKFSAKTGTYNTYTGDYRTDAEATLGSVSSITLNNLTGLTIDVTSRSFVDGTTSKIEQMLNVSGSASFTKNSANVSGYETSGSITIVGNVYVASQENLDLAASMTVTTTSGVLITEGSATIAGSTITNYKGAQYSVKVPNTTGTGFTIVNHYTTFDSAYEVIDTAESKSITLKGGYEFAKNYTIKADQSVIFENSTATIKYAISKDATVTVEKDGTVSSGFAASGIQGILIVNDGATCTPATGSYEVKSTDTAGNATYSGAAVAIENAVSGSTIDIVSAVEFTDKVTVPKDVTVKVANAASIDAKKGLSVNGTLVNNGTVTIANTYALDVAGTFDNNQTVAMGSNTTATITGTYTGVLTGCTINAAKYSANGEDVYTSVESALKAISVMTIPADVTVYGKVSENVDVTLSDGMKMTVVGNDVIIDSIRLVAGSTLIVSTGVLTTDIVGAVGKADTTGAVSDAVIGVKKVSGITVKVAYNESTATTTMTATLNGTYTGAVALEEGSVTLDTAASTTFEFQNGTTVRTLSISEGATLVIKNDVTFKDETKKGFSNAGKIESKSGMTFNSINVGGEVVIAVEKTVNFVGTVTDATTTAPAKYTSTTIYGTIILSEKEGKDPAQASISGPVYIGSAPSTLGADGNISGKINFATNGFAVVFDGSTFSTNVDSVKSTAYMINGDAFAKIYGNAAIAAINPIVDSLKDLDVTCTKNTTDNKYTVYNITWKSGSSTATGNVGDYESVKATIGYNSVNVKISAAPGMLVYIDDFKVETEKLLPIGEHTVTIYLQPDYEGTAVITFNGETITNGKIVIKTEMLNTEPTLVVTGATPVSPVQPTPTPTPVPTPTEKDDSMGITEYLLIILVVLAAILVVVVAIRMMRS